MSRIDQFLEGRFNQVRHDARYRPIIDRVKEEAHAGQTSKEALNVAVAATVDEFKREGRKVKADDVRETAIVATAAAAIEKPMAFADLPEGTDKSKHFLLSGLISLKIARVADAVLPRSLADKIGFGISSAIGWAKEVYDKFFATGVYTPEDIQADMAGAKSALTISVPGGQR